MTMNIRKLKKDLSRINIVVLSSQVLYTLLVLCSIQGLWAIIDHLDAGNPTRVTHLLLITLNVMCISGFYLIIMNYRTVEPKQE